MVAAQHKDFYNGEIRHKFNLCLESVIKLYDSMRVIKLKEVWDPQNTNLVVYGRMTATGELFYWRALDSAIRFNVGKRELFLACNKRCANSDSTSAKQNGKIKFAKLDRFWEAGRLHWEQHKPKSVSKLALPKPKFY